MNDRKLIPAVIVGALALNVAATALASSGPDKMAKELSAIQNAQTSISQAIASAESHTGGRAVKAEMERKKGAYYYEIKTVSKDKVLKLHIDPTTGKVVKTREKGFLARFFDSEDRDAFDKLSASPVTLTTAIASAEKETGGKTVEAEFENEDGKSLFEVKVAKDDGVRKVNIDASNGKVLKVSDARRHWHEND